MTKTRRQKGTEILASLVKEGEAERILKGGDQGEDELGSYVVDYIFGSLYARPGLDLKTKQIVTLTALATLGYAKPQLSYHIKIALNLGITRQDIVDIFTHLSGYAGFPAANTAMATAKEVFKELDEKEK